jgi:hypothetical protein
MEDKEIRLRILESAMKFISNTGASGVTDVCKNLEVYVFNSDKASQVAPDDGEKARRPRKP